MMSVHPWLDIESLLSKIEVVGEVHRRPDGNGFYVEGLRVFLSTHDITWTLSDLERYNARECRIRDFLCQEINSEFKELEKQVNATKID